LSGAHDHAHDHGHGPGHAHGVATTADSERRVLFVLVLTLTFMVVEVIGGVLSGSLALIADAGHMLTDAAALALSWFAFRMARRPADPRRSYGYHRVQVVAAFVNGLTLFAICAWIVVEAANRLFEPVEVDGMLMSAVAAVGLAANIVGFWVLSRGEQNLNIRSAALHVLGDLLGSVAAVGAGIAILIWGWTPIDPILSILVAGLILRSAVAIVRESGHILLEGTPSGQDVPGIAAALSAEVVGVEGIHHVHVWQLAEGRPIVTLHANVAWDADRDRVLQDIKRVLAARFGLDHATVQIEAGPCPDDAAPHDGHDHVEGHGHRPGVPAGCS